ncbi:MAG: S41 family peptidase [Chloroflexota bacterium]|nr:S41 family peptidase [Chloroflexota bacterium]
MRSFRLLLLVLMMAVLLASCGQTTAGPATTPTPTPALSSSARAYLTAALDIMQRYSVNRKKINWTTLRQDAFYLAAGSQTPADTYQAIRYAVYELGDHHSFFFEPQAMQQQAAALTPDEVPHGQRLSHGIGYLALPHFGGSEQATQQYILLAQHAIRTADQAGTCGWIVDLRINDGGNMWPMLAGVGPILGEGVVGSFVIPGGAKTPWGYSHGQAQLAGSTIIGTPNAYYLKHLLPPVAVLTASNTASSGEAIVVAFRGRPQTRSFGEPTHGIPTANAPFTLRDGATLNLTTALDADRTGHTYDSAIAPDQASPVVDPSKIGTPGDPGLRAATTWLHDQEGCQG